MTTPWRERACCPNCGSAFSTEAPVNSWIRAHEELQSVKDGIVITDGDKWVHRYHVRTGGSKDRDVQYLMTVEIKTWWRDTTPSQADTLRMANDLLRSVAWKDQRQNGRLLPGHEQNVRIVYSVMNGRRIQLLCYGVHKLRLSHATPDDSELITWDDREINTSQLVSLLRFDLHPDSLRPMEHRHHKSMITKPPSLFDLPPSGPRPLWHARPGLHAAI